MEKSKLGPTKSKSGGDTKESDKKSTRSFFSQLRHLAVEVDSGVEFLQQALQSSSHKNKNEPSSEEHAEAVTFLLHTKKDMGVMMQAIKTKNEELNQERMKLVKIGELMKNVLDAQKSRFEEIESFLEDYGYTKPTDDPCEQCEVSPDNGASEDDAGNSAEKLPSTPLPSEQRQSAEQSKLKTPKLEDYYSSLSESTIFIIKHGVPFNQERDITVADFSQTKHNFEETRREEPKEIFTPYNVRPTPAMPETPKLLATPGFKLKPLRENTAEQDINSARVLCKPQTPEPPTQDFTSYFSYQTKMKENFMPTPPLNLGMTRPKLSPPKPPMSSKKISDHVLPPENPKLVAAESKNKLLSTPEAPKLLGSWDGTYMSSRYGKL
ncbi:uncharacterized protein LOC131936310 [Physella acuta]|uniref:uncharacterized protein LOC131936310 n=1 Tax=Physella acuta TaxID=109671 RepID=UPI0027DB1017|nr:uncharacterized protein LOC131936310 [Physella acuta]